MGEPCWYGVGRSDDLVAETASHVDLAGHSVGVAHSVGVVYALKDECGHGQVRLSEGEVKGGFVECWWHGSGFDMAYGAPTGPSAVTAVPVYPVRVVAGCVEVQVPRTGAGVAGV